MTTTGKWLAGVGAAAVAIGVGIAVIKKPAAPAAPTPAASAPNVPTPTPVGPWPRVDVNTGCVQTLNTAPAYYTGDFALWTWQWGFAGANVVTGAMVARNGVGKTNPPFCSPTIVVVGDCWQSVTYLAASPNTPNWIIAAGPSLQCRRPDGSDAVGLQVWKWNGTTFAWVGLIADRMIARSGLGMEAPRLDGDTAYAIRQWSGAGPKYWDRFDLNAMTVTASNVLVPATPPIQADSQGYTYTIHAIHPNPIPPQYPGPNKFYLERSGGPIGTPSPSPSFVPTVTPTKPSTSPTPCATQKPCPTCVPTATLNPGRFTPTPQGTSFLRQAIEGMS